MKEKTYRITWLPNGPEKRKAPIYKIVLDCAYVFYPYSTSKKTGKYLIPPYGMMNDLFLSGGKTDGYGIGARWRPFSITEEEYLEIADCLENLDFKQVQKEHMFKPRELIWDRELNRNYPSSEPWKRRWCQKYRGLDGAVIFHGGEKRQYPLYLKDIQIGKIRIFGWARGDKLNGEIQLEQALPIQEEWKSCILDKEYVLSRKNWYKPSSIDGFKIEDVYGIRRSLEELFLKEPEIKKNILPRKKTQTTRIAFKPYIDPVERIPGIERNNHSESQK